MNKINKIAFVLTLIVALESVFIIGVIIFPWFVPVICMAILYFIINKLLPKIKEWLLEDES